MVISYSTRRSHCILSINCVLESSIYKARIIFLWHLLSIYLHNALRADTLSSMETRRLSPFSLANRSELPSFFDSFSNYSKWLGCPSCILFLFLLFFIHFNAQVLVAQERMSSNYVYVCLNGKVPCVDIGSSAKFESIRSLVSNNQQSAKYFEVEKRAVPPLLLTIWYADRTRVHYCD